MKISVIIPTFQARNHLPKLLSSLSNQSTPPDEIVIVDSSSTDDTLKLEALKHCVVEVIAQKEFSHGGTRNRGARLASGDILLFMTQDALPRNEHFIEALTAPIRSNQAVASTARQLPYPSADPIETFARQFNYPDRSHLRTIDDIDTLGIKAFFFSNSASAFNQQAFWAVGGFSENTIVNEDMLICAKLILNKHTIAYQSTAQVYHSHNYNLRQLFRRYFDAGVFFAHKSESLEGISPDGEGLRFVINLAKHLAQHNHWGWMLLLLPHTGIKYLAFQMGLRERLLPLPTKRILSGNTPYWK